VLVASDWEGVFVFIFLSTIVTCALCQERFKHAQGNFKVVKHHC